jgi:hypothetical protein
MGLELAYNDAKSVIILSAPADVRQLKALTDCQSALLAGNRPEPKDYLRRRTVELAAKIDKFWNDQPPPGGPPNNPVTDEDNLTSETPRLF